MKISSVMTSVAVEHLSGDTTSSPGDTELWHRLKFLEMREEPMGHTSAVPQARQEEGWGRKIKRRREKIRCKSLINADDTLCRRWFVPEPQEHQSSC